MRSKGLLRSAERGALVCLLALFFIKGFLPAWLHLNSDFPNYYLIARLHRAGFPLERVYDWTWLQRQKDHAGIDQGLVSFIPSTLLSALAVSPWCPLPPLVAKHHWLIVNLIFLLCVILLLARLTTLGWERVAIIALLAFFPLRNNFLFGQMHVSVLLFITFAAWLFLRGSRFLSGISLAIAASLKIYPALFLIYFLWKRQWRAAMGLSIGLVAAGLASLYLFGRDAGVVYLWRVLPAGLRGETIDPYSPAWNSWAALLRRLFILEPELNPTPVAHLPWLYALLQPLVCGFILIAFLWAIGRQKADLDRIRIEWAAFVFLLLFLSSQPGSYHFVVLILSAVLLVDYLSAREKKYRAALVLGLYALICLPVMRFPWITPTGWNNLLFFSRLALMTIFAAVLLWLLFLGLRHSPKRQFSILNTVFALSALIALVSFGFVANERHFRGQFENYNHRVTGIPENLFAGEPARIPNGYLFTVMTSSGYTIRRLPGATDAALSPNGDWFHATSSEHSEAIWAEQATSEASRIVRVANDAFGLRDAGGLVVENAEEPVVSGDGQFLAFLRPVKGRNSLWTWNLSTTGAMREAAKQVAPEEYDVREAAFSPNHQMIFSSKKSGRFRLYTATQSGQIDELHWPNCSARYPAVSPDGKWLAFACENGMETQIHVTDMKGEQDLQVTVGDCNSISPAWSADSKTLVYATDCGRGLGLTALAQVTVFR